MTDKAARLEWTKKFIRKPLSFWRHFVFSDEKRLRVEGLEGCKHFLSDPSLDKRYFVTDPSESGGEMVWADICARRKTSLEFIENTMDSIRYMGILSAYLTP